MAGSTARRIEVLAALHASPGITAQRLANRLGVTERTARRDVAELRTAGYRIDAEPGRYGGYTLASGTTMPPLALDADEAFATGLGLRALLGSPGVGPAAATALAKLTATVPTPLRTRLEAAGAVEAPGREVPELPAGMLSTLAVACRSATTVRIRTVRRPDYRDVHPHRLVVLRGRWYFVGWDRLSGEWRAFRVDRLVDVRVPPAPLPMHPDEPPDDPVDFVRRTLAQRPGTHVVRVVLHTSADLGRQLVDPSVGGVTDLPDPNDCLLTLSTDDLDWAARYLVYRNVDFDVMEPPELTDRLHALGRWLTALD